MNAEAFRYMFSAGVAIEDLEATLTMATLVTVSLHGEAVTRMEATHHLDAVRRVVVIDATATAGRDLAKVFTGLAQIEYGRDSFHVCRVPQPLTNPPAASMN